MDKTKDIKPTRKNHMECLKGLIKNYENTDITNTLSDIETIVRKTKQKFNGDCFYEHNSYNIKPELFNKQVNLFWAGTTVINKICEIGFNAGHSALLFLLGNKTNDRLIFTIFENDLYKYTTPVMDYLARKFNNVSFNYLTGNSIVIIPNWINENKNVAGTYDIVHVNGNEPENYGRSDMMNASILLRIGGLMIINNVDNDVIDNYINIFLSSGVYQEINILETPLYSHRIIIKMK